MKYSFDKQEINDSKQLDLIEATRCDRAIFKTDCGVSFICLDCSIVLVGFSWSSTYPEPTLKGGQRGL